MHNLVLDNLGPSHSYICEHEHELVVDLAGDCWVCFHYRLDLLVDEEVEWVNMLFDEFYDFKKHLSTFAI